MRPVTLQNRWEEQPGVISVVTEETRCDKKRIPTSLSIIYLFFLLSAIYIFTKMDVIYWSATRQLDLTCEVKLIIKEKCQKPSQVTKLWEKEKNWFSTRDSVFSSAIRLQWRRWCVCGWLSEWHNKTGTWLYNRRLWCRAVSAVLVSWVKWPH